MAEPTAMYRFGDRDSYRLIPQSGVRQVCLPMDSPFNACWDGLLDPAGRVFLAAATEITGGGYAEMLEYDWAQNCLQKRFSCRDVILPPQRAITASKFHTCMCVMEDGRIILTTHTTDKAPAHPTWLYPQHYTHCFEGFPGSSLIVYDPVAKKAENLGIPVTRESLYGGVYCPKNRCYYAIGYQRGHLYEYSFVSHRVTDFGKATEFETFRLHLGPDQNVYGCTRSGVMFRLNTKTRLLENLSHSFPAQTGGPNDCMSRYTRSMAGAQNVPGSSKFVFTLFQSEGMYCYDTADDSLTPLGNFRSADRYCAGFESYEGVYSMKFDQSGVLWYPITCYQSNNNAGGDFSFRLGASLMRWDVFHGGKPECLGIIGTPERANATVSALLLDNQRNRMYLVDTNHATDGFSLLAIDMTAFQAHIGERGPVCRDPYLIPQTPRYKAMRANADRQHALMVENNAFFTPKQLITVPLWHLFSGRPEETRVMGLVWREGELFGLCGESGIPQHFFHIQADGTLREFLHLDQVPEPLRSWVQTHALAKTPVFSNTLDWPVRSGRHYRAVPNAETAWHGGKSLVGTADGMLALTDGSHVFSFGAVAPDGPVCAICSNQAGTVAYGAAGDEDDLGYLFRFDEDSGLRWLGSICYSGGDYPPAVCNLLSAVSLDSSGTRLAVGCADRLGTVCIAVLE